MNNNTTIYKAEKSFLWGVLFIFIIVFFGLTLPPIIDGVLQSHHIKGLIGFYTLIILLTIAPFVSKLEVGENYIRTHFFGFSTRKITNADILVIEYGNLMRFGGLGYSKGLKLWVRTMKGDKSYYNISENMYGKEAVEHARRVLEPQKYEIKV